MTTNAPTLYHQQSSEEGPQAREGTFVKFPFKSANFPLQEGVIEKSKLAQTKIVSLIPLERLCGQHHIYLTHRRNCGTTSHTNPIGSLDRFA